MIRRFGGSGVRLRSVNKECVRREMNCGIIVGEARNNHHAIDKSIRKACEQPGDD